MENDIYLEISVLQYSVDWVLYVVLMIVRSFRFALKSGFNAPANVLVYNEK